MTQKALLDYDSLFKNNEHYHFLAKFTSNLRAKNSQLSSYITLSFFCFFILGLIGSYFEFFISSFLFEILKTLCISGFYASASGMILFKLTKFNTNIFSKLSRIINKNAFVSYHHQKIICQNEFFKPENIKIILTYLDYKKSSHNICYIVRYENYSVDHEAQLIQSFKNGNMENCLTELYYLEAIIYHHTKNSEKNTAINDYKKFLMKTENVSKDNKFQKYL